MAKPIEIADSTHRLLLRTAGIRLSFCTNALRMLKAAVVY